MSTRPDCKGCPSYYECMHDDCGIVRIEGICTCKGDCTDCGRFSCEPSKYCVNCEYTVPTLDGRYMCEISRKAVL